MLEVVFTIAVLAGIISGLIYFIQFSDAVEHLKKPNPVVMMFWPYIIFFKDNFTDEGQRLRKSPVMWLLICVGFNVLAFVLSVLSADAT